MEDMKAQAQVWKHIYGFAESLALKCAIELGIADILYEHGQPMTLSELASSIPLPSVSQDGLYRVLRYLVHMKLFDLQVDSDGLKKYWLTPASKLLVKSQEKNLASFALLIFYEMDAWHHLSAAVEGTVTPFEKCHEGEDLEELFGKDSVINRLLSEGMTNLTSLMADALVKGCKKAHILDGVGSLIDVGGSTGVAARAIAKSFPSIKCAVLDLPHVVANAPECSEVTWIEGDMFVSIPKTDVVFMKSVLHDCGDEDSVKILKICKEAISEKGGKVVIVEIVMDVESSSSPNEITGAKLNLDMSMLVTPGGKERSEEDWQKLFKEAGYSRYKITPIAAFESIIEVFP
ncbi:PREDICTED: (RS)-norcoclaurine 6-O-methyltransferase-like isoform X2 [Nelumbo nucifera]|uniref:(RS)-norcoclaurine 6-O-methyltransferase-like n=2 Tax=Nelumbo nucifera TaxID=4432 RepID=A0A822XNJ7_NELNU|nr:PREDICTED: (RS)-norcoclaurine 6-O-methyltransferase-like isoform X2 [Nelumbo nucifera]DAD20516.1 TPA_asm: hypothetical protein HUJ06_021979 [Nelumbo nucifera]